MSEIGARSAGFRARELPPGASMFSREAWSEIASSLGLSFRELEIVRGTFDGKTEAQIAAELCVSSRTIHTHVERLHHKLVITDRAQLVLRVAQEFIALTAAAKTNLPPICARKEQCPFRTP